MRLSHTMQGEVLQQLPVFQDISELHRANWGPQEQRHWRQLRFWVRAHPFACYCPCLDELCTTWSMLYVSWKMPNVCRLIDGPSKRCFKGEILPELKHLGAGMLGMTSGKEKSSASQFYITLAANLDVRHLHKLSVLLSCGLLSTCTCSSCQQYLQHRSLASACNCYGACRVWMASTRCSERLQKTRMACLRG